MPVDPIGWVINAYQINQTLQLYNKTTDQIDEALTILDFVKESCKRILDKFEIDKPDDSNRSSDSPFVQKLKLYKSSIELSNDYLTGQLEKLKKEASGLHEGFDKYFPKTENLVNDWEELNSYFVKKEEECTSSVVSSIENLADEVVGGFNESSKIAGAKATELINDTADMLNKSTKGIVDSATNASKKIGGKEIPPTIKNSIEESAIKEIEKFREKAIQIVEDLTKEINTGSKSLSDSLHENAKLAKSSFIDNREEKLLMIDELRKDINKNFSFPLDERISKQGHSVIEKGEEYIQEKIDLYNVKTEHKSMILDSVIGIAEQIRYIVPSLQKWVEEEGELIEKSKTGETRKHLTEEEKRELEESLEKLNESQNNLMKTVEAVKTTEDIMKYTTQENKISNIDESLDRFQKKVDSIIGGEGDTPETEEKVPSKKSDTAEKTADAVTNEDLGIEVRDSKRSVLNEIAAVKARLENLIKEIEKKAMTFDEIYVKFGYRMARDHRNKTGRIVG